MNAVLVLAWGIGGAFVAAFVAHWVAVNDQQDPDPYDEPHTNTTIGFVFFVAWMLAPLAAAVAVGCGISWLIGRLLRPQDDRAADASHPEGAPS